MALAVGPAASGSHIATASILLRDPASAQIFSAASSEGQERFVSDQIEILQSPVVSQGALEILNARFPNAGMTLIDLAERTTIDWSELSNVVSIRFEGSDEEMAVAGANALIQSLEDTLQSQRIEATEGAIARINDEIAELDQAIGDVSAEIQGLLDVSARGPELEQHYQVTLDRYFVLQDEINQPATPGQREIQALELLVIQRQLEALNLIRQAGARLTAVEALTLQQTRLTDDRAELNSRLTEIEIDRALETTGIEVFSPASFALPAEGLGLIQFGVLGLLVGLGLGVLSAYLQSSRRIDSQARPSRSLCSGCRFGCARFRSRVDPIRASSPRRPEVIRGRKLSVPRRQH